MGESLNEWRRNAVAEIKRLTEQFKPAHVQFPQLMSESLEPDLRKINVPFFRALLERAGYEDCGAASLCECAPIVGEMTEGPSDWQKLSEQQFQVWGEEAKIY